MGKYQCISTETAYSIIKSDDVYLVDVRHHSDFVSGHIEKAIPANDKNIMQLVRQGDKTIPVIVYCYHGNSSKNAAEFISQFGFSDVYSMDGGYEAWKKHEAANS